jgi:hypothetical protein
MRNNFYLIFCSLSAFGLTSPAFAECPKDKSQIVCNYSTTSVRSARSQAVSLAQNEADAYCEPNCIAKTVVEDTQTPWGKAGTPSKKPKDKDTYPTDEHTGEYSGVEGGDGGTPANNFWCSVFTFSCKAKPAGQQQVADLEELMYLEMYLSELEGSR